MMAVTLIPGLRCNHEEADTRMFLDAQHAGGKCVLHADDTNVLVLLLGHAHNLSNYYLKKGKGAKSRIVGISEVADQLGRQVVDGILKQELCKALIGLHALTGCDTVSALTAKGKWCPLQMIAKNQTFDETMKNIGKEWSLSDETFKGTEELVCNLYGKKCTSVNSLCTNFIAQRVAKLSQKLSRHASHHCDSMCLVRTTRQLSGGEPQRRVLTSVRLTDMGGAWIRPIWNLCD